MKKFFLLLPMVAILALVPSCVPAKAVTRVMIDAGLALCAAENPDKTPEEIQVVCGAAEEFLPFIRNLLAAQRRGAVKLGAPPPK